jgi:hypothetical protein
MPAVYTTLSEQLVASRNPVISLSSVGGTSAFRDKITTIVSGTVTALSGEIVLDTGVTVASTAALATAESGLTTGSDGALALLAIRVSAAPTGAQGGLWGYFDDTDGVGFGIDATSLFVFSRKAGTDTKVYQANFNTDKLDGTGTSSLTLNPAHAALYDIEFTPYGSIFFRIILPSTTGAEQVITAHALIENSPVMGNTNCPLNVEAFNGTTASSFKVYVGSREFNILNSSTRNDRLVSHYEGGVNFTNSAFTTFLNLRKKTTGAFPYINARLDSLEFSTAFPLLVQIVSDVTVDTPTWQAPSIFDAAETACEVDHTDVSPSGGSVIYQFVVAGGFSNTKLHPGVCALVNDRVYSIKVKGIGGSAGAVCNVKWTETW